MYQNSAPFHVLNGIYRVWVTLIPPPVSSTSKKPSGGRVKVTVKIQGTYAGFYRKICPKK